MTSLVSFGLSWPKISANSGCVDEQVGVDDFGEVVVREEILVVLEDLSGSRPGMRPSVVNTSPKLQWPSAVAV